MFVNTNKKEDLYEYIIKRHAYYEAKLDVIDDKLNVDKIELNLKNNTNTTSNATVSLSESDKIEKMVKSSKEEIRLLKRKIMIEEKNLLGLYKIKINKY